jgi:endonuclease/exonuclease/phosphatase family metal-dependent hydrolase
MLDLSFTRLEKRVAVAVQLEDGSGRLDVVVTHLALGDRTRHRQVQSLLEHRRLREAPTLIMGDMNAWRRCPATRALDEELRSHHNEKWPASFPSASPVLALDRIYAQGLRILVPVVASVALPQLGARADASAALDDDSSEGDPSRSQRGALPPGSTAAPEGR